MGYIKHHAICVSSSDEKLIKKAHRKAKEIFGVQTGKLMHMPINVEYSFYIGPDGSKEGWDSSNKGDDKRDQFISWVNDQAFDDGSNSLSYAEIYFGEDNGKSEVTRHN